MFRYDTAGGARNKTVRAMSAVGVRTRQSAGLRGKRSKAINRKPGKLTHRDIQSSLKPLFFIILLEWYLMPEPSSDLTLHL